MRSVKIIILLLVFLLLGYILGNLFSFPWRDLKKESGIVCTMDAKECPDGSYVGRIPPNCEFAPCPETREVKCIITITNWIEMNLATMLAVGMD